MAKQTIKLKKYADIINEYNAEAAITPGMLIELTSSGTVQKNSAAGLACAKTFALEDELQGKTIADAYAAGAPVQCWSTIPGEEVYAWLANGEDVSVGDKLVSNGAGLLKAMTADDSSAVVTEETPIAIALEDVDMSGSSGVDPTGRIKVRII
jgi:hypothetical protein